MKKKKPALRRKQVLIIEDDRDVSNVLSVLIQGFDADVVVADDGKAGLEACRRIKPDLVLVDLLMPGMSGVEVIRAIRETFPSASLPIIVITGNSTVENIRETARLGADDFLVKANVLSGTGIDRIRSLLKKSRPKK